MLPIWLSRALCALLVYAIVWGIKQCWQRSNLPLGLDDLEEDAAVRKILTAAIAIIKEYGFHSEYPYSASSTMYANDYLSVYDSSRNCSVCLVFRGRYGTCRIMSFPRDGLRSRNKREKTYYVSQQNKLLFDEFCKHIKQAAQGEYPSP